MSVNPGFGGQKFMPEVLDKVKKLKDIKSQKQLELLILKLMEELILIIVNQQLMQELIFLFQEQQYLKVIMEI